MNNMHSKSSRDYFLLQDRSDSEEFLENGHHARSFVRSLRGSLLPVALAVSLLLNLILVVHDPLHSKLPFQSWKYAGVGKTIEVKITRDNQTLDDEIWGDERYETWQGVVALDEDFVKEHGLLPAQDYPWDPQKGLYFVHGFHSMHCIKLLKASVWETRQGLNWTAEYEHITHCLNVLRDDIICYADDFPRYTGPLNDQLRMNSSASGLGSVRQCRDWDQLRKFVKDNSACYQPVPPVPTTLEQYKFCPDGSKPWEKLGH